MSAVTFTPNEYIFSHGKAPRGEGLWMFDLDGEVFEFFGMFSKARAGAITEARRRGAYLVKVLP